MARHLLEWSTPENAEALGQNQTNLTNWDVTNGSIDLVGLGLFDFIPGNGRYVDLDGSTANAGDLSTKEAFSAGIYTVSFALAGSQRGDSNTVVVSLGSLVLDTITLASSEALATFTYSNVALAVDGKLTFSHQGGDNLGLLLDNVVVRQSGEPPVGVPEPATLGLIGAGLLGLGAMRRRKA